MKKQQNLFEKIKQAVHESDAVKAALIVLGFAGFFIFAPIYGILALFAPFYILRSIAKKRKNINSKRLKIAYALLFALVVSGVLLVVLANDAQAGIAYFIYLLPAQFLVVLICSESKILNKK